jgi:hypothetical protein
MIDIEKINTILKGNTYIAAAYLFGSVVSGRTTPMSDVDIAVLLNDNAPKGRDLLDELDSVSYRLETVLRVADVTALNNQGLIFIHNVLKTGKLIYDADPNFRIKFVARAISYYCDFEPTLRFMDKYYFEGYKRRLASL